MNTPFIIQVGFKPAKKTDQNRTVFINDTANSFFEKNTGLGMDLTSKLAEQWFIKVIASNESAMNKILSSIKNKASKNHGIALDLELNEEKTSFKRGIAVSFNTLAMYLQLLGVISYKTQCLVDFKGNDCGCIYLIELNK